MNLPWSDPESNPMADIAEARAQARAILPPMPFPKKPVSPEQYKRLAAVWGAMGEPDIARHLLVVVVPPPAEVKARALAGKQKPKVCPRHGPAPSGLCRRC